MKNWRNLITLIIIFNVSNQKRNDTITPLHGSVEYPWTMVPSRGWHWGLTICMCNAPLHGSVQQPRTMASSRGCPCAFILLLYLHKDNLDFVPLFMGTVKWCIYIHANLVFSGQCIVKNSTGNPSNKRLPWMFSRDINMVHIAANSTRIP